MRKTIATTMAAFTLMSVTACSVSGAADGSEASSSALSSAQIAAIQQACETVSIQYAQYLDAKDWENLPNAFAPDGVWEVLGNRMEGAEQIQEYWRGRTADWDEHHGRLHQISNQTIEVIDADNARGTSMVTIYFFDTRQGQNTSLTPLLIAKNHDSFVRTDEGWKIAHRRIERIADASS